MGREERCHRLRLTGSESRSGAQKFQELLAGADRETIKGMGDNVGVQVIVKVEAHGEASRARTRGIVVRDVPEASRVRVADCDWS